MRQDTLVLIIIFNMVFLVSKAVLPAFPLAPFFLLKVIKKQIFL